MLRWPTIHRLIPALAVAAAMIAGCGKSDSVELASVSGVVELDGQPLAGARVEFNPLSLPEATKKGAPTEGGSFAITDEDGSYSLQFGTGRSGAVIGEHSVKITTRNVDPESPDSRIEKVPRQYNVQTQLKQTVTEGDNVADFALTTIKSAKR